MCNNLEKQYFRVKFKNIKKNISSRKKILMDNIIQKNIFSLKEYCEANIVLAYMANDIEVNIDNVILAAILKCKKVAIPKCENIIGKSIMNYYFIDDFNNLIDGKFAIREPDSNECKIVELSNNYNKVIMFVPGIVFDKCGYRIGYGKGYYDRYLSNISFDVIKIGVCYNVALVDEFKKDSNDVPVDILVTEEKIIKF